jgi:uncharacterized membrane protein YhaH (DUF805 family)
MKRYFRSVVRTYFIALFLVILAIGIQRLFGYATRGSWWLWLAVVPATLAVILSIPVLFPNKFRSR